MTKYLIHFDQNWVGDHSEEWFASRGPLAMAVVREMEAAGVLVFAGGLEEELRQAFHVDPTGGTLATVDGPYRERADYVGGMTVIDAPDDATAKMWAARIAEACGWPQELRAFKGWADPD